MRGFTVYTGIIIRPILLLSVLLGFSGPMIATAESPEYPLVTLEIPTMVNHGGAPEHMLPALQHSIIKKFRDQHLFADVVADVTDINAFEGVMTIQAEVQSWEPTQASTSGGEDPGGTVTIDLIMMKKMACTFNRETIHGVIDSATMETGVFQQDHELVRAPVEFLLSKLIH